MRKLICIVTVCFMIITVFSGCAALQKLGLQQKDNEELTPVSSIVMNEGEAQKLSDKVPIHLYFVTPDGNKLKLEVRYIPVSEAKKSTNNLASVIVKELISGPSANTGLKRSIPEETKLLKQVSVNSNIATVDFSKEFVDKQPDGKTAEQLTIYSIVNSLTEMKDVEKVKFTINGKTQAEYKGNFKFDVPFPRNTALISKETASPNNEPTNNQSDTKKQDTAQGKSIDTKLQDSKGKDTKQTDTKKSNDKAKDSISKPASGGVSDVPTDSEGDAEATYLENLE